MKSIVTAWRNRRKIGANVRPIESTYTSTSADSLNQDSAYGSLTVFSSSVVSAHSQRSSIDSNPYHNSARSKNEKSNKKSSQKKLEQQQQKKQQLEQQRLQQQQSRANSLQSQIQSSHDLSNDGQIDPSSTGSFARMIGVLSRILSRKNELPDDDQRLSSLTDGEYDQQVNGSLFQHSRPRSVVETLTPSITSIHPLCMSFEGSSTPIPMNIAMPDVTAPACFPGAGSAEFAVKQHQLLQLQISSRRPSASSLNPLLNSPISQRRNSRHLIPHHSFEHGGNNGPNNHQDTQGYGSPLASRRSSVGSISIASGLYPTPALSLHSSLNNQSSISSWTALSQERRPSVQSMNDIEFISGGIPKSGQSQKRRGSTFSIASDGLALCKRERKKAISSRIRLGQGYDISTMFQVGP